MEPLIRTDYFSSPLGLTKVAVLVTKLCTDLFALRSFTEVSGRRRCQLWDTVLNQTLLILFQLFQFIQGEDT